jgi:hypothetical protein
MQGQAQSMRVIHQRLQGLFIEAPVGAARAENDTGETC